MAFRFLVPKDTAALLDRVNPTCENMRLLLARYVPYEAIETENHRGERFKWMEGLVRSFQSEGRDWYRLCQQEYQRWLVRTDSAQAQRFERVAQNRVIVGLGGKGVLEIGITLKHITGLPSIPGSALKGLTRAYMLLQLAAQLELRLLNQRQLSDLLVVHRDGREKRHESPFEIFEQLLVNDHEQANKKAEQAQKLLKDLQTTWTHLFQHPLSAEELKRLTDFVNEDEGAKQFKAIFGTTADSGRCIFYDAVVAEVPTQGLFEIDVMTPHFGKYYTSVSADKSRLANPTDDDRPIPVHFLTVAAGTRFAFAVGHRHPSDQALARIASEQLRDALYELGIGAKTNSGYGIMVDG